MDPNKHKKIISFKIFNMLLLFSCFFFSLYDIVKATPLNKIITFKKPDIPFDFIIPDTFITRTTAIDWILKDVFSSTQHPVISYILYDIEIRNAPTMKEYFLTIFKRMNLELKVKGDTVLIKRAGNKKNIKILEKDFNQEINKNHKMKLFFNKEGMFSSLYTGISISGFFENRHLKNGKKDYGFNYQIDIKEDTLLSDLKNRFYTKDYKVISKTDTAHNILQEIIGPNYDFKLDLMHNQLRITPKNAIIINYYKKPRYFSSE